jgi:hypothetical protein
VEKPRPSSSSLERLSLPHVELGLALHGAPEVLGQVLGAEPPPEGVDQVALALDGEGAGPFLVATRGGAFLEWIPFGVDPGGMPVLPRERLEDLSSRVAPLDALLKKSRSSVGTKSRAHALLRPLFTSGQRLSREAFVDLAAFQPLYGPDLLELIGDGMAEVHETREMLLRSKIDSPKASLTPVLRGYWNTFWALGHMIVLTMLDGRVAPSVFGKLLDGRGDDLAVTPACDTVGHGILTLALRGLWATANAGEAALAPCRQAMAQAQALPDIIASAGSLIALGSRHPELAADAREALRAELVFDAPKPIAELLVAAKTLLSRGFEAHLDRPEETLAAVKQIGATVMVQCTQEAGPDVGTRFEKADDVPSDVAFALLANSCDPFVTGAEGLRLLSLFLPPIARLAAQELYLPKDLVPALPAWTPETTMELVKPFRELTRHAPAAKAEVPRQGPCPCGSGKKYKRCCGK